MPTHQIRRALIAVYDKTGIAEFARALVDEFGIEIISTGGTARHLKNAGVPVTLVETLTGFPELLDGRVKTLHPKIHAAILADRDNPEHMRQLAEHGIEPIDMVVVNLYPFEKTVADPSCKFEDAIEMIDIGGPCLLRAAAKNHKHVLVDDQPQFYEVTLRRLRDNGDAEGFRDLYASGAFRAFWRTAGYDAKVAEWLSKVDSEGESRFRTLRMFSMDVLRYGENPHQVAENLHIEGDPAMATLLSEVQLSYNNFLDADAAHGLCAELAHSNADSSRGASAVACFIKHTNACGVGIAGDPAEAYRRAYLGDPNAAMGGILAVNFPVTVDFATTVMETYDRLGKPLREAGASHAPGGFFVEVWVAPSFDENAVEAIRSTKMWGQNVRLLAVGDMTQPPATDELAYRSIAGGMLVQSRDTVGLDEDQWNVVTRRRPTEHELSDLKLAWLVAKHTKSNAISICKEGMLIGNGAGQMSRVMSCRIATWLARENGHAEKLAGSAAASDAFFPFADGPNILIDAGVTAIIQPGGSKRDDEVIRACDERGVAMIFTGTRHFRH